jgi:putative oxidoreductase
MIFRQLWSAFDSVLELLTPVGDLIMRVWLFKIFFFSALTKLQNWDATIALFTHEYKVPFFGPQLAATSATVVELIFPVLLLLGLGGRFPAFVLFVYNIVAVISYDFLFTSAGRVGLVQHYFWGIMLMVLMTHGSGKLALDQIFKAFFPKGK